MGGRLLATMGLGLTLTAVALTGLAGCSQRDSIRVMVASSAQDAVGELARTGGSGAEVATGGSSALVRQLIGGADGDVLITADGRTMEQAAEKGLLADGAVTVARSRLVLAVPTESTGITALADLTSSDVDVVLCSEPVPCGRAAARALDSADVTANVVSHEPSSRQALAKVALGEADATLVWAVDVVGNDAVRTVPLTRTLPTTAYRAAVLAGSVRRDEADSFVARLTGAQGRATLAAHGFTSARGSTP